MRRFSNRFWQILWPVLVAAIHLGLLAGSIWLFPSHGEPGISLAFPLWLVLLWPWFVGMWALGKFGAAIGIVIGFLWLPGIAFLVTRTVLKRRDKRTPNQVPEDTARKLADPKH